MNVKDLRVKIIKTLPYKSWIDSEFNTSLQHTEHTFTAPKICQCNTKNPSVQHTPQFNTQNPSSVLTWGVCWTEGFLVLNWLLCWTEAFLCWIDGFWGLERSGPFVLNWGGVKLGGPLNEGLTFRSGRTQPGNLRDRAGGHRMPFSGSSRSD